MLRGAVLVFLGIVTGNAMRFLLGVLLARHLAAAGFGLFNLAAVFSLTAYNVIGLAPSDGALRCPSRGLDAALLAWTLGTVLAAGLALSFAIGLFLRFRWNSGSAVQGWRSHFSFLGSASLLGVFNVAQALLDSLLLGRLGTL